MPYSLENPPDTIKSLPKGAKRIWIDVFNSAWKAFDGTENEKETASRMAAWAAVKKVYHRLQSGEWKQDGETKQVKGVAAHQGQLSHSGFQKVCPFQRKHIEDPVLAKRRIAFTAVLEPWETDVQGEIPTPEEVEDACYAFMKKQVIGIQHQMWDGIGSVAENFIAREGDKDFKTGAWVMGIEFTEPAWNKVVNGELTGLSIGGHWDREPIEGMEEINAETTVLHQEH